MYVTSISGMVIAAGLAVTPVAEPGERNVFRIPQADDVRMQALTRVANETGWPFTVDEGLLLCLYSAGAPLVMFAPVTEMDADEASDVRLVTVSTDPFEAIFGNVAVNDLIVRTQGPEERIALFAPFERMGKRLCEQPRGTEMGPGEL